eukprot:3767988-Pyramimonas_sp.AAC.1
MAREKRGRSALITRGARRGSDADIVNTARARRSCRLRVDIDAPHDRGPPFDEQRVVPEVADALE